MCLSLCLAAVAGADPIPAKHIAGDVHAFLVIRNDAGRVLGYADEVNTQAGRAWRSRLTIRFLDGSLSDENALYRQSSSLRLLSDHLVQKGPSFPAPVDLTIDTGKGRVSWHEQKDGKDELKTDAMTMPADLANGMLPMVLQNFPRGTDQVKVGYIVCAPKPRLVTFVIRANGQGSYRIAGASHPAAQFHIHINIGGVEGMLAPILGKEPPDTDAWVSSGDAPTFLKMHGILFLGGPQWTLQLVSPHW